VHHVGILYDQFMMHGQRNIKDGQINFCKRDLEDVLWVTIWVFKSVI